MVDIFNNPLLLVAVSAVISAVITAAIETVITNRQKAALERKLEELRHKHALEVEQLRFENASQLEREAAQLRLAHEHERDAADQRLVKLPNAIAAAYQLRYLYLDFINTQSSEHNILDVPDIPDRVRAYVESVTELSKDLLQVADPDFRNEAYKLVSLCQIPPSLMTYDRYAQEGMGPNGETPKAFERLITWMRPQYEEVKEAQTRLLEMIKQFDEPPKEAV